MEREQLATLTPADAAVALRSYARRIPALLSRGEIAGTEIPLDEPVGSGWSVAGLLRAADNQLQTLAAAVTRALDHDAAMLDATVFERPAPSAPRRDGPAGVAAELEQLGAGLVGLAERVERTPAKDWERPVSVGPARTDAAEVLRESVAYGRTVLDELGRVLDAARRSGH